MSEHKHIKNWYLDIVITSYLFGILLWHSSQEKVSQISQNVSAIY